MSTEQFESWGIIELFGHQQIAGKISEASIGGCSFVRVDVPDTDETREVGHDWKYTRYFGQGAIYALNPTSEVVARVKAHQCQEPPFAYDVNRAAVANEVERRMQTLAAPKTPDTASTAFFKPQFDGGLHGGRTDVDDDHDDDRFESDREREE